MTHTNTCPVNWRGNIYPSIREAAKEIGCWPETISRALAKHGCIDHLPRPPGGYAGNKNAAMREFRIHGMRFVSQKAAAEALGVSRAEVCRAARGDTRARERLYAACMRYGGTG